MSKYIGVMIAWIILAGILFYVVQHSQDLVRGIAHITKGGDLRSLFQSVNTLFK